jgi:molybdate transport system substrate-binding protein
MNKMHKRIAAAWVGAASFFGGALASAETRRPLTIAAATNVRPALEELKAAWEKTSGVRITISYGPSGILTKQIEQGAPFDLFLSADSGYVAALESKHLIVPGSRAPYAIGSLVVVAAKGRPAITSIQDLTNPVFGRIAIANPTTAPYGLAAFECLKRSGLDKTLRPHAVVAETVRDALRYVETGDADAGFAALSEARQSGLTQYTVPQDLYPPIRQELAVVNHSRHRQDAVAFSEFLRSASGREVWVRHGYQLP